MAQTAQMHPELHAGDVLVGDRAFCSFAHLALLFLQKLHGVFRIHQRQLVDFRPRRAYNKPGKKRRKGLPNSRWVRRLGAKDQLVEWFKPKEAPEWMRAEQYAVLPASLLLRELRYQIDEPGFRTKEVTLVTTLLDPDVYSAQALAQIYRQRWQIETNLRHLKQTMGLDVLHCATKDGVLKELTIFALVYNLVRVVMCEAARRQEVPLDRISFVDALRWISTGNPNSPLPTLIVNPRRPGRSEPRVRKRRPKEYPLMKRRARNYANVLKTSNLRLNLMPFYGHCLILKSLNLTQLAAAGQLAKQQQAAATMPGAKSRNLCWAIELPAVRTDSDYGVCRWSTCGSSNTAVSSLAGLESFSGGALAASARRY